MWPEIWRSVEARVEEARLEGHQVCVVDAAVMLKAGWHRHLHEVWVTIAPENDVSMHVVIRGIRYVVLFIFVMKLDSRFSCAVNIGDACQLTDHTSL